MDRGKTAWKNNSKSKNNGRQAIIKGTRLSVQYILNLLANGYTVDELLESYNGLKKEDIIACLLYASETIENTTYMPLAGAV